MLKSSLLLLVLLWSPLFGLISITPVEIGEKPFYSGQVAVSLATKRGNSDTDSYKLASRVAYDNNVSWLSWLQVAGEYGEAGGVKNVQKIYAHLRYIHAITTRYHVYELFAQTQEDKFRLIQRRRLAGGGYRVRLFPKSPVRLYFGIGAMYEYIDFTSELDPTEYNTRLSSYFSASYKPKKGTKISFITYYQPKFSDMNDFVSATKFELAVEIFKKLFLNFSVSYDYDSRPAVEVESKYDFSQDTAFIYKF